MIQRMAITGAGILLASLGFMLWVASAHFLYADAVKPKTPKTIWLDDMTWAEVREAIRQGHHRVLVPFGGTEQGGLHLVLGKHNHVIKYTVEQAAQKLGATLATPVIPISPQGDYDPPTGNMPWAGTLGLRPETFKAMASDLARSLKIHGFKEILFVADHGLSIDPLDEIAKELDAAWAKDGVRVHHLSAYYLKNGQTRWLQGKGFKEKQIGYHAGIKDTSEMLVVHPKGVRDDRMFAPDPRFGEKIGTNGDPKFSSREIGQKMLSLKIEALVKAVNDLKP